MISAWEHLAEYTLGARRENGTDEHPVVEEHWGKRSSQVMEEHPGDGVAPREWMITEVMEKHLGKRSSQRTEEHPGDGGAPRDGGAPGHPSMCQLSDQGSSVNTLSAALVFGQLTDELC